MRFLAYLFAVVLAPGQVVATPLQLLEQTSDGVILRLDLPVFKLEPVSDGTGGDWIAISGGFDRVDETGQPRLPFASTAIAVPVGASVSVDILDADVIEYDGVRLQPQATDDGARALSPYPGRVTEVEELGLLRGVRTAALRVFPFQYDVVNERLAVYEELRIAVRFRGAAPEPPADKRTTGGAAHEDVLFAALLNPMHVPAARAPAPAFKPLAAMDWYDPQAPWVKIFVVKDALHRIDAEWLEARQVAADAIDPRSFRLFLRGEEQFLHVAGQEDGSFDADDHVLFSGRYRRSDEDEPGTPRDFDSIYGRRNTYWLTWGGETGLRFVQKSGAPESDYPQSDWHWATAHFERDLWYQQFKEAPDNDRDHWFWRRDPIRGNEVETSGSAVFADELQTPYLDGEEYTAAVRAAFHGLTPGHHTTLKLNSQEFENSEWDGQVEKIFENEIPSSYLLDGTNRLTVLAFASPTKGADWSFFNWFEIDYRKRYAAWLGYLAFDEPAATGKSISVTELTHPEIELLDVTNGIRLVDLQIDSVLVDTVVVDSVFVRYVATFEHAPDAPARYVIADSAFISTPLGLLDTPSQLRSPDHRGDYLIITNPRFAAAASRLADHRRLSGLEVEIAVTDQIYDEFSFGLVKRQAIQEFIRYAYENWEAPPIYVVLMGDATYDYRNIIGGGKPSFVPTLYYHARDRGHSPNDYRYALIDDDMLPDLAIGRLAVESAEQAEWTVDRIIRYDEGPESGDWRSRAVYAANYHDKNIFSDPSDSLASRYTEPFGLSSVKVYNPDNSPLPNLTGRDYLDALNAGALTVNFAGHGSAGNMQFIFALQFPDWDYLSHVRNGSRLPFVTALSCLNGMFVNPVVDGLGEVFTTMENGGAIAFVSATAISRVLENNSLSDYLYDHFFRQGNLQFGPTLNASKVSVLAAHSSYTASVLTMQLFGDPAQELALPLSPDYEAVRLETAQEEVLTGSTITLEATLRNNSPRTADSVTVAILGRQTDGDGEVDTLLFERRASFAGTDTLRLVWTPGELDGMYMVDFLVDLDDLVSEFDESNNATSLALTILQSLRAEPVFPPAHAALSADGLSLEASVPPGANLAPGSYACEFSISASQDFPTSTAMQSPPITAVNGRSVFVPPSLPESDTSTYYWRVRILDGASVGPWSATRGFSLRAAGPGENTLTWRQSGDQFSEADLSQLEVDAEGRLKVSASSLPMRPSSATREDGFTVRDLEGSGVVCSDGTYLYAKRWFNDDSTVYPGVDFFARVGSGFNGTRRDLLYEFLADSTTAGISATYHSDGLIYNESGRAFELERLSVESGRLDTVEVPAGLLEWKYGLVEDGHSLITSDGRHIYNVSMSSATGTRTGWGVRVFDPANDWELVREFTSPPTETGFTFEWTDGVVADGERLYLIEFGGERRIRMIDAEDGTFLDEWVSDQDTTRVISGQYDWVNNKLWLGDLFSSAIFRYSGVSRFNSGTVVSEPIGPARVWHSATIESAPSSQGLRVDVQAEDGVGSWTTVRGDLAAGSTDLDDLDASRFRRLRLNAHFENDSSGTPLLNSWEVAYEASAVVEIVGTAAELDSLHINLGIALVNRSPATASDFELTIESLDRNGRFRSLLERRIEPLDRGETRHVRLDSLALPATGERLFARLIGEDLFVEDTTSRVEITLPFSATAPFVRFSLREDGRALLDGDPLLPGQAILISAPAQVDGAEFVVIIDDRQIQVDSLFAAAADTALRALIQPQLSSGPHELRVELLRGGEVVAVGTVNVMMASGLVLANLLIYPHPIADETAFTYVLSHDADVTVEVFSLAGRLVRRLQPGRQAAGFQLTPWDSRSDSGQRLASGTYLCRVIARSANGTVEHRRPLTIMK